MKSPNLQPTLSPTQSEILVGGMLGDMTIYRAKPTHNARLYVQQGSVHTEYLNHLYSVFQNLCSSGPKLSVSKDKRSDTTYELLDLTPVVCLVSIGIVNSFILRV